MSTYRVAVILSTYNGSKYLEEQLSSLTQQVGVQTDIYIRDDGSTDNTRDILEKFSSKNKSIKLIYGKNIGFRQSFIKTLEYAHKFNYDYYAFCDQDDYWLNNKLFEAIKMIENYDGPSLYYSNLYVADSSLKVVKKTRLEEREKSLQSILMRRSIAGCTMVFNNDLANEIFRNEVTDDMLICGHDSFLIIMCYALGGKVFCDSRAFIKYRQHGDNSSGAASQGLKNRVKKETRIFKGNRASRTAAEILKYYYNITDKNKKILSTVALYRSNNKYKRKLLFSNEYKTGNPILTLIVKFEILSNNF